MVGEEVGAFILINQAKRTSNKTTAGIDSARKLARRGGSVFRHVFHYPARPDLFVTAKTGTWAACLQFLLQPSGGLAPLDNMFS